MALRSLVSTPFANPCHSRCPNGFTGATEFLLHHLSRVCETLLDLPFGDYEGTHFAHLHLLQHHLYQPQTAAVSRVPRLSALGLASLLLGIASTLMFLGSFALLLGLLIIPFVLPLALISCIGILLANLKAPFADLCSLFPASSSSSTDPIPREKLGFESQYYEK